MRLHVGDVVLDLWPEVVGDHVMHCLGSKNAPRVELTALEQHLSKAQVVPDGGKGARSGTVKRRRRIEELNGLRLARQRIIGKRAGETRALRLGEVEGRIFHAEWLPNISSQVVAEALFAYLFNNRTQHVNRELTLENRPRLMRERQLRHAAMLLPIRLSPSTITLH